ncbi:MAG: hypothetical protein E4H03_10115 [Myxococcales bacterium]|nr:MAG: hypothetical protein E4H03_10115 [Myxococcales bacterium]
MEDLQRIGVKLFCSTGDSIALVEFIPVFHRWIQTAAVEDMLIDVADYSHVPHGPGILLVGHEGIYAMDETGGRRGMAYYFRRPEAEGLTERLLLAAYRTLAACRKLETEPELDGKLTFDAGELEVFANDRLLAPNRTGTLEKLAPAVDQLLARLWPGSTPQLERRGADGRERFSLTIHVGEQADVATLLERVAA